MVEMESRGYFILNDLFLLCMCKRFVSIPGTKVLILNGKELSGRIKRRIMDTDIPFICNFLSAQHDVVSVNLAFNNITDFGMITFVNFLKNNVSLLELNLMNNDITGDGILTLAGMKNSISLKSLRINGNKIGPKGLKSLGLFLSTNVSLTNLDIGETDLDIAALVYFTTAMQNNNTLQAITLNRILGPPGHVLQTDHVAQLLQKALMINCTLRELRLQKIGFVGHDIEALVVGLKSNTSILLLDLSCNNFGDHGIECISEYLALRPSLQSLFISHNDIGDTGARALSNHFPYTKIEYLDISRNKLTDKGLLCILNCLKKEHPIQGLFLRGNSIGEKVCKVLFRMLLSGVLFEKTLDVKVYQDKIVLKYSEMEDHLRPHYYCLCADSYRKYCQQCTIMEIRNKI